MPLIKANADQILHLKDKMKGKISNPFQQTGRNEPSQLRESAIAPDTRRLLQLSIAGDLCYHGYVVVKTASRSQVMSW
jgi:topoisomerase-4 subunit B